MNRLREVLQAEKYLKLLRAQELTEREDLIKALDNKWFRICALYYITDKNGKKRLFKPNKAQRQYYVQGHNRDLILKARQLGFTTFKMISSLDSCLFVVGFKAGCIAHEFKAAKDIYQNKIRFAYRNISAAWKAIFQEIGFHLPLPLSDTDMAYRFDNESSIQVSTSYRGGTLQDLHISEFGKICAKYPEKAREIVTGAIEAVGMENSITIESTAEGRSGYFFTYCDDAQKHAEAGKALTVLDFKFHFFPWWQDEQYALDQEVTIPDRLVTYFSELEGKGVHLSDQQKWWYVKKEETQQDDMTREYPSTPEEAFKQSVEGAYYKRQMSFLRKNQRITYLPYNPSYPVLTGWDLGMSDEMTIWFAQVIGGQINVIDYYENSGEGFEHYAQVLNDKKYNYSYHFGPHDLAVRELGTSTSRIKSAAQFGIRFEVVPRVANQMEGIHAVRQFLPRCSFDESKCDRGIDCLDNYRKEWSEKLGCFIERPLHDWASHGAKGFETLARAPIFEMLNSSNRPIHRQQNTFKGAT